MKTKLKSRDFFFFSFTLRFSDKTLCLIRSAQISLRGQWQTLRNALFCYQNEEINVINSPPQGGLFPSPLDDCFIILKCKKKEKIDKVNIYTLQYYLYLITYTFK